MADIAHFVARISDQALLDIGSSQFRVLVLLQVKHCTSECSPNLNAENLYFPVDFDAQPVLVDELHNSEICYRSFRLVFDSVAESLEKFRTMIVGELGKPVPATPTRLQVRVLALLLLGKAHRFYCLHVVPELVCYMCYHTQHLEDTCPQESVHTLFHRS
jgi:hypothetical protein